MKKTMLIMLILPLYNCFAQITASSGRVGVIGDFGKVLGITTNYTPSSPSVPELVLTTKKANPAAFGAGADVYIDPTTATIVEVTNLNDSGAGSFRNAVGGGNRIVIIKVEGFNSDANDLQFNGSSYNNIAIWGQFAPGLGYTLSHPRFSYRDAGNFVFRFITLQGDQNINCTPNTDCFDPLNFYDLAENTGYYLDHLSLRYGQDQTWTVSMTEDEGQTPDSYLGTFAYNIMAEGDPDHSTASIINYNGNSTDTRYNGGDHTWSRNVVYNVDHRFPNVNLRVEVENYNNLIGNTGYRLSRMNTPIVLDFHRNYYQSGPNTNEGDAEYSNFFNYGGEWDSDEPSIYSAFNFIESLDETVTSNMQTNQWAWFDDEGGQSYYGVPVSHNNPLPNEFFTTTLQHGWNPPSDGYWNTMDVKAKGTVAAGHNRGINTDGTPFYGYDDLDSDYMTRIQNNTELSYRAESAWTNSTFPNTSMYTDTDGDHMPDWFENQFAFLDPNSSSDMLTTSNVTWDFSAISSMHNYIVTNNAGYTNLEMCSFFYAGDFETMIDGTNNLNIGDD